MSFLLLVAFLIAACSEPGLTVSHFNKVGKTGYEMCFNEKVDSTFGYKDHVLYHITFKTKSGEQLIEQALIPFEYIYEGQLCYRLYIEGKNKEDSLRINRILTSGLSKITYKLNLVEYNGRDNVLSKLLSKGEIPYSQVKQKSSFTKKEAE